MEEYISKQNALKIISEECHELRGVYGRIEDKINEYPPADVVERQLYMRYFSTDNINSKYESRWILVNPMGVNKCYACEKCGHRVVEKDNIYLDFPYCSNCGSKMREEKR